MSSLLKLPVELQALTYKNLGTTTLSALSQTCKALRPVSEPFLYESISWHISEQHPLVLKKDVVHLLLRTILSRPELASLIKHFQYIGVKFHRVWSQNESCFSANELSLAREAIAMTETANFPSRDVGSSKVATWVAALENGLTSAILSLLLLQLTSLETLDLDFDQAKPDDPFMFPTLPPLPFVGAAILTSVEFKMPSFKSLHSANFSARVSQLRNFLHTTLDPAEFLCLFYLPSIRHIALSFVGMEPFHWPQAAPIAYSLRSLTISLSRINLDNLEAWIQAAPNLSSLSYHVVTDCDSDFSVLLDCRRLKSILLQIKANLEHLSISTEYAPAIATENSIFQWGVTGDLGDLSEFDRLQYLRVPLTVLLERSSMQANQLSAVFPYSLRQLCLIDDVFLLETDLWTAEDAVLEMCNYLLNFRAVTPKLEKFQVSVPEMDDEYLLHRVDRVCESIGLEFEVVIESGVEKLGF